MSSKNSRLSVTNALHRPVTTSSFAAGTPCWPLHLQKQAESSMSLAISPLQPKPLRTLISSSSSQPTPESACCVDRAQTTPPSWPLPMTMRHSLMPTSICQRLNFPCRTYRKPCHSWKTAWHYFGMTLAMTAVSTTRGAMQSSSWCAPKPPAVRNPRQTARRSPIFDGLI